MGFFSKLKEGLTKTRKSLTEKIEKVIIGYADIDDDLLDELEDALIQADVGVKTSLQLMDDVRAGIKKKQINSPEDLKPFLIKRITEMLNEGSDETNIAKSGPTVILVIGVNGVGKTTSIGKLASQFKNNGKKVVLAAADTFRAAAADQLIEWANRAGVDIVSGKEGSDPGSVLFDAISSAKNKNADILLCDTAGRLHNKKNLMEELKKLNRIIDKEFPETRRENFIVLDATTGQNALEQARQFKECADITGVILTKMDGSAKGGIAIAIQAELGIPVKYIGVGEQIDDLQRFDSKEFVEALFTE